MALSGQLNTTAYETRYIQFSWTATQNIAANTSTITWTLKGAGSDTKYYMSGPITLVIAGDRVYSNSNRIQLRSGDVIATGTKTFTHSTGGSKSFSVSIQAAIYTYAVNCTGSATFSLDTIARASQPSCITYPNHTQNVGKFGDTISIHMNRNSSAFTHTVRYAFGSLSGTCIDADTGKAATAVGTGFKWKIPVEFMDLLPASVSGSGTIYVDTYNGSTKIGTKYCGFTATVPDSVKPSCTLTLDDTTGIDDVYGKPVKGLSKIKVTVNTTQAYSSPIASISIKANGVTYSGSPITTEVLKNSGTSTVTATVTDKRGRKGTVSYNMSVLDYAAPAITALSVRRCNEDGTANDRGNFVQATFSATLTNTASKNTATYKLQYKKSSSSVYTTTSLAALAGSFSVTNHSVIFAADGGSSYDVVVSATDNHSTTTKSTSASTAFTLINFGKFGDAISFGGVSEERNTFRNNLEMQQTGNRYAFQTQTYNQQGYTLLATIDIVGTSASSLVFVLNKPGSWCPMTVYIKFINAGSASPASTSLTYEGDNYNVFLVSESTTRWKLYTGSEYGGVCVQDWFTTQTQAKNVTVTFAHAHVAGTNPNVLGTYYRATPVISRSILDAFYPVGYILLLYSHARPDEMYPGTSWERIQNAFLWAVDYNGEIGLTGGAKEVALTESQLPAHSHGSVYSQHAAGTKSQAWYTATGTSLAYGTVSTGGGAAHNNMPPYIQVSVWRRTA